MVSHRPWLAGAAVLLDHQVDFWHCIFHQEDNKKPGFKKMSPGFLFKNQLQYLHLSSVMIRATISPSGKNMTIKSAFVSHNAPSEIDVTPML